MASKALAPLMAGVALVESSGNPDAYNSSGASGLWQIEIPINQSYVPGGAGNVFNALDNAKAAVALSGNSMAGITNNWLVDEPAGAAQAIVAQHGGTVPLRVHCRVTQHHRIHHQLNLVHHSCCSHGGNLSAFRYHGHVG